jgi:peptidoglycan/xylan/chitin deacetylase (PgdA/CDA1 family)
MYHSISDESEKGHPYFWTNTSPNRFAEHMRFLHDNDYKVISLSEAVDIINHNTQHSTLNTVVLTFDDGYRDFYTHAFPILNQYSFSATVFLPTSFIDNERKEGLKAKEHLSWDEVRELRNEGIAFGSHTVTHSQIRLLDRDQIEGEIKQSKDIIEYKIGRSVESFSYPFAFPEEDRVFTKRLRDSLERCGYENGVSTSIGRVAEREDRFFLKRIPVNSCDDIPFLMAKLEGGYDWLHKPQYFFKRIKKELSNKERN